MTTKIILIVTLFFIVHDLVGFAFSKLKRKKGEQ